MAQMVNNIKHASIIKKISLAFLIVLIALILFSCTVKKSLFLENSSSKIEIKLLNDNKFESLLYENFLDTIILEYSTGSYKKLDDKTYIFNSDKIDNLEFQSSIYESKDEEYPGKLHLICKTNFDLFKEKFCSYLYLDDVKSKFNGVDFDTVINFSKFRKAKIEVLVNSQYINSLPKLSFNKIVSKEFAISNLTDNVFVFQIPISYKTYFYKYYRDLILKDLGGYFQNINSGKKFKKQILFH